jgi:allantoate deiminase
MQAAHKQLHAWMESAGIESRVDPAANLIGRLGVRDASSADSSWSLIIGSHLDTVIDAGKYDGTLGVLIGLAIAELITQAEFALPFSLDIIAFSEEEGVRYQTPYIGSRALAGDLPAELLRKTDAGGIPMADALRTFGCNPGSLSQATFSGDQVIAYIEPHIEQGPVLELEGLPVGVVSGIAGQTRATFQFLGRTGHAGTTPMTARHDALAAAAQFICEIEEFAHTRPGLTATVGQIAVAPNVSNVIPGEVNLRLDLRHIDDETREAAFRQITHQAAVIAQDRELEFDLTSVEHHCSVNCDAGLADLLDQSVDESGIRPLRLPSGAGHDAVIMSRKFPVAMLFIRCGGGVSHHPDESVTEPDVAAALRVLWRFVMKLASQRQSVTCP